MRATVGVECCKEAAVADEMQMAHDDIDVSRAGLMQAVHILRRVACVKG
jgi:hypothetical protein